MGSGARTLHGFEQLERPLWLSPRANLQEAKRFPARASVSPSVVKTEILLSRTPGKPRTPCEDWLLVYYQLISCRALSWLYFEIDAHVGVIKKKAVHLVARATPRVVSRKHAKRRPCRRRASSPHSARISPLSIPAAAREGGSPRVPRTRRLPGPTRTAPTEVRPAVSRRLFLLVKWDVRHHVMFFFAAATAE